MQRRCGFYANSVHGKQEGMAQTGHRFHKIGHKKKKKIYMYIYIFQRFKN